MHTFYRQLMATAFFALLSVSMVNAGEAIAPSNSNLPATYPSSFQGKGIIGGVSSRTLTVDGSRYALSISARVHSLSGNNASRLDLRGGTEIGFSFVRNTNNRRTITEIWILPQGTIKPS